MTIQTIHSCDICFAEYKVPLEGEVHMVLHYNGETQFDGDLCPKCHEALIELKEDLRKNIWVNAKRFKAHVA